MELSEIEKKVILKLADFGPLGGYDFHLGGKRVRGNRKAIMSSGHWKTVEGKLGTNGLSLIQVVEISGRPEKGSGRRKKLFWLTDRGIASAIDEGANLNTLLSNVKIVYPKDDEKASLVEILGAVPEELRRIILDMVLREGKISPKGIISLLMLGLSVDMDAKEVDSIVVSVLRKYPDIYRFYRQTMKRSARQLKLLGERHRGKK